MRIFRNPSEPAPDQRRRRDAVFLLTILLLALLLRVWGLGEKSLWLDETLTVLNVFKRNSVELKSFRGMVHYLGMFDAHPPLYQTIVWLWLHVGRGDAFVRLPSVAAGAIGVWLCWLIARRLFGRRAGFAAALLMTISCFHIYYSQEARLNAMATTFFLAQAYLLLHILGRRGRASWWSWAAYGAFGLLSLYTYVLCILTIGALALVYLWRAWKRRLQPLRFLAVHVAIALLFLPWVPLLRARTALLEENVARMHDAAGRPGVGPLAAGVAAWAFGPVGITQRSGVRVALGLAALAAAAVSLWTRKRLRPAKVLSALFLAPLAGYLIVPMPRVQAYDPKHLVFLQPLLIMALSAALAGAARGGAGRRMRPLWIAVLVAALLNVSALVSYYRPSFEKENWRDLFGYVDDRLLKSDALRFNPEYVGFAFAYYARTPEGKAGAQWLARRGLRPGPDVKRIWLIECRSPVARPAKGVADELHRNRWKPGKPARFPGALGYVQATAFTRRRPPDAEGPP